MGRGQGARGGAMNAAPPCTFPAGLYPPIVGGNRVHGAMTGIGHELIGVHAPEAEVRGGRSRDRTTVGAAALAASARAQGRGTAITGTRTRCAPAPGRGTGVTGGAPGPTPRGAATGSTAAAQGTVRATGTARRGRRVTVGGATRAGTSARRRGATGRSAAQGCRRRSLGRGQKRARRGPLTWTGPLAGASRARCTRASCQRRWPRPAPAPPLALRSWRTARSGRMRWRR